MPDLTRRSAAAAITCANSPISGAAACAGLVLDLVLELGAAAITGAAPPT